MKIIKDAGGRIQKKKMAEEAEKRKIIIVNAKKQNFTQARFASLDKNIVQPLVETWGFVEVEKIGRNRWLKMTEDGDHAAEFLI
jgi:ribose 5-phosphate isomerase